MRLIIAILLLFTITACSSPAESTENANSEPKEDTYIREITEEEQKYIDLVIKEDYETLLSLTENGSSELQKDYYNIAFALIKQNEIIPMLLEDDGRDYATDTKLSLKYGTIVRSIESVKFIPPELKTIIDPLYETAVEKKEYYSQKQNAQMEKGRKEVEENLKERQTDFTTKNPKTVKIGMTQEEVLTEGWGRPNDINRTITANGTDEQWVYDDYKYLYFEDGILTTIQD